MMIGLSLLVVGLSLLCPFFVHEIYFSLFIAQISLIYSHVRWNFACLFCFSVHPSLSFHPLYPISALIRVRIRISPPVSISLSIGTASRRILFSLILKYMRFSFRRCNVDYSQRSISISSSHLSQIIIFFTDIYSFSMNCTEHNLLHLPLLKPVIINVNNIAYELLNCSTVIGTN